MIVGAFSESIRTPHRQERRHYSLCLNECREGAVKFLPYVRISEAVLPDSAHEWVDEIENSNDHAVQDCLDLRRRSVLNDDEVSSTRDLLRTQTRWTHRISS